MSETRPQLSFDWRLGAKEWFSPQDVADILGMGRRFVEKAYDKGLLSGHSHNAESGSRDTIKIHRSWLAAYLILTANYDHEMKLQLGNDVLKTFDRDDLIQLRNYIDSLLTK